MRPEKINDTVITFCGQDRRVVCDRQCCKAWGRDMRPCETLSDDDFAYLSDHELGVAPVDPGTYEGTDTKPKSPDDFPNKWCVRQCERCTMAELGAPVAVKTFEQRVYNKDKGEPEVTVWFVGEEVAVEHLCVRKDGNICPTLIMLPVFTDGKISHVQCTNCEAVWDVDSEKCVMAPTNVPNCETQPWNKMSLMEMLDVDDSEIRPAMRELGAILSDNSPVYLALPYSHDDEKIRQVRFRLANRAAARLISDGFVVYSPISHSHPIAVDGNMQLGWEGWQKQDLTMLRLCKVLFVLKLPGWQRSAGVQSEIKEAERMRMPIYYLKT